VIAFDEVFRANLDYVWRVARVMAGEASADDVAQEVFIVARRRLATFDGGSVRGWLYCVTRNVVRNLERARRRHLRLVAALPEPEARLSPDEALAREEAAQLVDAFLATLAPVQRDAFMLHVLEGLTAAEIAGAIGVPTRTVYSRVRAARNALDRYLQRHRLVRGAVGS
jgi:RNA polymerase sigma-70 factor (ECF subfamily)